MQSSGGAISVAWGCSGYPEGCVHVVHAQETGNGSPSCTWSPDLGLGLLAVARVMGSG